MQTNKAILMVDDDPDECLNMLDILSDLGYRVDTAQEGRTALLLVEGYEYDLALLDLKNAGHGRVDALSRSGAACSPECLPF